MADGASSAPAPAPAPVAARGRPTAAPGPIELSDEKTVQTLATPDSFGGLGERLVAEPRRRRLHRLAALIPLQLQTTSLPRLMPPAGQISMGARAHRARHKYMASTPDAPCAPLSPLIV